jgi:hypothetical protein
LLINRDWELINKDKLFIRWFLLIGIILVGVIYFSWQPYGDAIFFISLLIIAALLWISTIEDKRLRYLLLVLLLIRIILAIIQAYSSVNLPGAGVDSVTFESHGWRNAQALLNGTEGGKSSGAYFFSWWIGIIYYYFGRIPFIVLLINVIVSLVTIYLVYRTALFVTNSQNTSWLAALLFAIIPTINSYSAILLRETFIYFFLALFMYSFIVWMNSGNLVYVLVSFCALAVAGMLHGPIYFVIAILIIYVMFYNPKTDSFKVSKSQAIMVLLLLILSVYMVGDLIKYQLPRDISSIVTPEHIRKVLEKKNIGRTTYLENLVPNSFFDLIWQTPIRMIYFLFAPFPWVVETRADLYGLIDVSIYIALIFFCLAGAKSLWKSQKKAVIAVLAVVIMLVGMFSWGTTNYGTAWRHRQKMASFIVVLAAVGIAKRLNWNEDLNDKQIFNYRADQGNKLLNEPCECERQDC